MCPVYWALSRTGLVSTCDQQAEWQKGHTPTGCSVESEAQKGAHRDHPFEGWMDGDSGCNRTRSFQVSFLSGASTSNPFPSDRGVEEGTMRVDWRTGGGGGGRESIGGSPRQVGT